MNLEASLLILSLATWPAAAYMRSQVSFWAPKGVVGGEGTWEGPFGLPLLEADQLTNPLRVDWGELAKAPVF